MLVQGNKFFSLPVLPHWGQEGTLGLFPSLLLRRARGGGLLSCLRWPGPRGLIPNSGPAL